MEILGADIQESLIKEAKIRLGQSLIKTNVNYLLVGFVVIAKCTAPVEIGVQGVRTFLIGIIQGIIG